MKIIRRLLLIIILIFSEAFLVSCISTNQNNSNISILESTDKFVIGEKISFSNYLNGFFVYYESSDDNIVSISNYIGVCNNRGACFVYAKAKRNGGTIKTYFINVFEDAPTRIDVSANTIMNVGEEQMLSVTLTPSNVTMDNISFYSSNEKIATINKTGVINALSSGLVTIGAKSNKDDNVFSEVNIFVYNNEITSVHELRNELEKETVDISNTKNAIGLLINKSIQSIVKINCYKLNYRTNNLEITDKGTGVIYKRTYVLSDLSEVDSINENDDFKYYKYYCITNKHLLADYSLNTVVINNKEINAKVLAYDTKVDIGVISFIDTSYYSVCDIGDSDTVETGDFCIAIGNGVESQISSSLGIVSYDVRYVASDTDGDLTSDWDALYIQHDASITSSSSGGPLINLKGEVIGINSTKISNSETDNMAFSIPINTVMSLVTLLEQGITPTRPLLGVTIIMVKDALKNEAAGVVIPDGIKYGAYVEEVTSGSVASKAGVQIGDIILELNGVRPYYSYELRAALNEIIIGSGEEISVIVYRNGKEVELKAVF